MIVRSYTEAVLNVPSLAAGWSYSTAECPAKRVDEEKGQLT
jgi:hypothetical protein